MKKILLSLAAVAMLAACSKEETLVQQAPDAIGFDTFVDNATRSVNDPSLTSTTLADFAVFGYVEGAVLFDGTKVANTGINNPELESDWKYEGTQYWITGALYNFNAVAPYNGNWNVVEKDASDAVVTNATQTTVSFTNNGTTDLLYAYTPSIEGKAQDNDMVAFTFRHTLSKVKFSFENAYNATNATIKVKDVKITDAYETATATLTASSEWADQASSLVLDFGNAVADNATSTDAPAFAYGTTLESYKELLMIPGAGPVDVTVEGVAKKAYTVTFDVELYQGESTTAIRTYHHTILATFVPEAGYCYDLVATITPENIDPEHQQEPIEFTVTKVADWANGGEPAIN